MHSGELLLILCSASIASGSNYFPEFCSFTSQWNCKTGLILILVGSILLAKFSLSPQKTKNLNSETTFFQVSSIFSNRWRNWSGATFIIRSGEVDCKIIKNYWFHLLMKHNRLEHGDLHKRVRISIKSRFSNCYRPLILLSIACIFIYSMLHPM